jgi:hypothetical protein
MNLNPRPRENPLPLSVNQLRPIPDLNMPPEDQGASANASGPAAGIKGFASPALQKKELFLRQALDYLRHSSYPASHKVGNQNRRFRDKVRQKCKPFRLIEKDGKQVMVGIEAENPSQEPRRVLWGEERLQVVQSIHDGEGHYGGVEKTRLKVSQRYWFPSLTTFVRQYVKHCCDNCARISLAGTLDS